jgi:hypothetical protein
MNICVNYWGQPRLMNIIEDIYKTQINDNINNFHICYSTWKTENISIFKEIFPNSYIKQYDYPNLENYSDIIQNYKYDNTTISRDITNYIYGLFIREQSINTINEYMNINNVSFDFIITIRPDTDIYNGLLYSYYNNILENKKFLYVATHPRYDIYNQGAIPDALLISNYNNMKKILKFPNFETIAINSNIIHPETATGKNVIYNQVPIKYMNLSSFRFNNYNRP